MAATTPLTDDGAAWQAEQIATFGEMFRDCPWSLGELAVVNFTPDGSSASLYEDPLEVQKAAVRDLADTAFSKLLIVHGVQNLTSPSYIHGYSGTVAGTSVLGSNDLHWEITPVPVIIGNLPQPV